MGKTALQRCGTGRGLSAGVSVCLVLALLTLRHVTDHAGWRPDASIKFAHAETLAVGGTMSLGRPRGESALTPSNYCEPLPTIVAATNIVMTVGPDELAYGHGDAPIAVKYANVLWTFIGLCGVWALAVQVLRQSFYRIGSVALSWMLFFDNPGYTNNFLTELHAAALLVWCAAWLAEATHKKSALGSMIAGVSLGLLSLTKASFVYIGLAVCGVLLLHRCVAGAPSQAARSRGFFMAIIVALAFVATVSPWLVRNKLQLDRWEMSPRGGFQLLMRAHGVDLTWYECLGAVWYWGPPWSRSIASAAGLKFSDSDFVRGGRFERVAPIRTDHAPINFYLKARQDRTEETQRQQRSGIAHPLNAADDVLRTKAREIILGDMPGYLRTLPAFLWRQLWFVDRMCFSSWGLGRDQAENAAAVISLALWVGTFVCFARAALARSICVLMAMAPAVLLLAMMGLASEGLPRYCEPAIPCMLVFTTRAVVDTARTVRSIVQRVRDRLSMAH